MGRRSWIPALLVALGAVTLILLFTAEGPERNRDSSGIGETDRGIAGLADPPGKPSGESDPDPTSVSSSSSSPVETPIESPADIVRQGSYSVTGKVLGAEGSPLAGAKIRVFPFDRLLFGPQILDLIGGAGEKHRELSSATSDADGLFTAYLTSPGEYLVEVAFPGRSSAIEAPVRLTELDPTSFIFFTLPASVSIAGIVLDSNDEPVTGVSLSLLDKVQGSSTSYFAHRTRSEPDGTFLFDGLEPRRYILMAHGRGSAGAILPSVEAPHDAVEVRLEEGVTFEGVAVDSRTTRPIRGASVTALNPLSYARVETDAEGRFTVELLGDDADLLFQHPDYLEETVRIELDDGASSPVAFPLDPGAGFRGRVVLSQGELPEPVPVGLLQSATFLADLHESRTDDEGHFTIAPYDPSKGALFVARLPGWAPDLSRGVTGGDGEDIVLELTGAIHGVVVDERNRPLGGAWVRLSPAGDGLRTRAVRWMRGEQEAWTDDAGRFVIEDVVHLSTYLVEVAHPDGAHLRQRIGLLPEEPIRLVLSRGCEIEGRILGPGGRPPEMAVLVLEWKDGPPVTQRTLSGSLEGGLRHLVDHTGRFAIGQLPAGPLRVHVQAPPFLQERVEVEVHPDRPAFLEILLQEGHRVTVSVVDESGAPRGGVRLVLSGEAPGGRPFQRTARTLADGTFTFEAVPPGAHRISASQSRTGPGRQQRLEVGPESPPELDVEIVLPRG